MLHSVRGVALWQKNRSYFLSDEEAEALQQAAEMFLEGLSTAEKDTVQDRTIKTPEALLDLTSYYHRQEVALCQAIVKLGLHKEKWGDQSA